MKLPGVLKKAPLAIFVYGAAASVGIGVALEAYSLVFMVIAAVVVASVAMKSIKLFLGIALLGVMFSPSLERWTGGSAIGLLDEVAVGSAVVFAGVWRLRSNRAFRGFPGVWFFGLFVLFGIASSLVMAVPGRIWLPALTLAIKGVLFGWAVAQADWTYEDIQRVCRSAAALICLLGTCGIANFLAPSAWAELVKTTYVDSRYGFLSINGPFVHPAAYGRVMALCALGALAYAAAFGRSRMTTFLASIAAVAAIASFRRKTIVGLLVSSIIVRFWSARWSTLLAVAFLAPFGFTILWDQISSTVSTTIQDYLLNDAARTRLTRDGGAIANDYFPLGAGFGRFGSAIARESYSPEYVRLGYASVYGLGPDVYGLDPEAETSFLIDTQWPAVVGESGWFGMLAFAVGLGAVLHRCFIHRRSLDPTVRFLAVVGIGWSILFLIESVAAPVYTSAPSYPLLFAVVGLLVSHASKVSQHSVIP